MLRVPLHDPTLWSVNQRLNSELRLQFRNADALRRLVLNHITDINNHRDPQYPPLEEKHTLSVGRGVLAFIIADWLRNDGVSVMQLSNELALIEKHFMLQQCEFCKYRDILVKHHWYIPVRWNSSDAKLDKYEEDEANVCRGCNSVLTNRLVWGSKIRWYSRQYNHILPHKEWQVAFIKTYRLRESPPNSMSLTSIREALKDYYQDHLGGTVFLPYNGEEYSYE